MLFLSLTGVAAASSASDTASAALLMPSPSSIGLAPAATCRSPALIMACASTVAVVVPSPATSLVLVATDFTSCAPRFSNGSSRSISRATVTPSLVTAGPPNALASTTCLPRGPSVTRTAPASLSTPASNARRAVSLNSICLLMNVLSDYVGEIQRMPPRKSHVSTVISGADTNAYLLTTASTSRAERIKYSSPLYLISVPPYLL